MAKKKDYELITADLYEESDIRLSLGNSVIDALIGGGIPPGKMVEIYGDWSTGKTVLAWTILREAQKAGAKILLAESEDSFSKEFASKCGLDLKNTPMLVPTKERPLTAPDFFRVFETEMKASQRHYPFFVGALDSLAALNSAYRLKDGLDTYDKQYMGDMARQMSQGLNKLKPMLRPHNAILIIVNQVRDKIGVMFGAKEDTPGGRAVKFYSDLRLLLHNPKKERKDKEDTGVNVGFHVVKSKLAPPFGRARILINFETGLDPKYGKEDEEVDSE